jgi:hypothetical protein
VETSDGKAIDHGEGQRRESCEVENWKWSFRAGNPTFVSAGVSCDVEEPSQLNPEAPEYNARPRRQAATTASQRIQEIVRQENEKH